MVNSSFILRSIVSIYNFIVTSIVNSFTYKALATTGTTIKRWFVNSGFYQFLAKCGRINDLYQDSFFHKFISGALSLPGNLFAKAFDKYPQVLENSLFYRALKAVLKKFHLIIGLYLVFLVVIPFDYWNNMYAFAGNIVLLIFFLLKVSIFKESKFNTESLGIHQVVFALSILLAFVTSINIFFSLRFFVFYFSAGMLFLVIISEIDSLKKFDEMFNVLLFGITFTGLYGILQWIIGIPVSTAQVDVTIESNIVGRVYSTIGNSNNYAELLVLTLPFYVTMFLNNRDWKKKVYYVAMISPCIVSLLLTYSRSSWVGFAFAAMIFVMFKNWRLIPVFGILGLMAFPFLPASISSRVLTIFTGDSSTNMRFVIWGQIVPMMKDYWITGMGLGPDVFIRILKNYPTVQRAVHAHNIFMQILLEVGIVGLLAFIGMHIRLVKESILTTRKAGKHAPISNHIYAAIGAVLGFLLIGTVEYVWHEHRIMLFYFITLAFSIALIRNAKEA